MVKASELRKIYTWPDLCHYTFRLDLTDEYHDLYESAFDSSSNVFDAILKIRKKLIDDGYLANVRTADESIDWDVDDQNNNK